MRFEFVASKINNVYERKVMTIFDALSFIGGIYKSLTIVGFLICAAFSYHLFMASLIRKVFHMKPRYPNESPKKNRDKSVYKTKVFKKGSKSSPSEYIKKNIDKKLKVKEIKDEIMEVTG